MCIDLWTAEGKCIYRYMRWWGQNPTRHSTTKSYELASSSQPQADSKRCGEPAIKMEACLSMKCRYDWRWAKGGWLVCMLCSSPNLCTLSLNKKNLRYIDPKLWGCYICSLCKSSKDLDGKAQSCYYYAIESYNVQNKTKQNSVECSVHYVWLPKRKGLTEQLTVLS